MVTYIGFNLTIGTVKGKVPMTELNAQMRVGLRIKELRGSLGMSQEAFANSIDMSRTYHAEVGTGRRNVSIVSERRSNLGVSLQMFFNSERFSVRRER
jgi:DNA-binding XRE family transcriptional regulator